MIKRKLFSYLSVLLSISLIYLVFLCLLDLVFVVGMQQKVGWYNYLSLMIFTLPVLLVVCIYKRTTKSIFIMLITFILGSVVAYLEFMWIAIEFHTLIGGQV